MNPKVMMLWKRECYDMTQTSRRELNNWCLFIVGKRYILRYRGAVPIALSESVGNGTLRRANVAPQSRHYSGSNASAV